MKVAVTGATGFIGRHVIANLNKRGINALQVVQPGIAIPNEINRNPVVELNLHEDIPDNIYNRLDAPEILIHLAWGGLPNYKSAHHLSRELPAHNRFLTELVRSGIKTLIVAGTCLEYGMQSGALSETMETKPNNPYATAKDILRRNLEELQKERSFALTWARFFYLYGEGQAAGSLFPQLKRAVEQGNPTFDMSGGEQLRDYLPIEEAAECLIELSLLKNNNGVVNICSGKPITVRQLVEEWIEENNWKIKPNLGVFPYPDYEPMAFWGTSEKYLRLIGEK